MLLSFIIPTYNRAHSVARAIESVLREFGSDGTRAEILVIDDGSTDDSKSVLRRFQDIPAVMVLTFATNRGLAHARNAGIQAARGRWIALLDSDNALLPDVGDPLYTLLNELPTDVGVLWGGSIDSDGHTTITHAYRGVTQGQEVIQREITGEHFSVVRRTLLGDTPYPTSAGSHACEAAVWAELAGRTQFYLTDYAFQYYETSGSDRICAADNRIRRAEDFARCFALTAERLRPISPKQAANSASRAALYWSLSGSWGKSVRHAAATLFRGPVTKDGVKIFLACLGGPWVARSLIRRRG